METGRKSKVLVVDDEPAICDFLGAALEDAGYDVTVATDGRLEGVNLTAVELALVDIFMPGRDGFAVIQHLRKSLPQVAIVAMTGDPNYHGTQAMDIVRPLGADATLSKPFAIQAVLSVCAALLKKRP